MKIESTVTQDKIKESEFFDRWAESKDYDVLTASAYAVIIREFKLLAADRLLKGCRIVDLGCGTGAFSRRFFRDLDGEFFGVDISLKAIELAKQKDPETHYIVGDIEKLDFSDNSFDVVVFSGVLHHFLDFRKCLAEGYRILKSGGCMLSYDPNSKNPFMWLYRHQSSPLSLKVGKTDNEILFSAQEARVYMENSRFTNIHNHAIGGITFKYIESPLGRFFLPAYNFIETIFGYLPVASSYGSFLICYGAKD